MEMERRPGEKYSRNLGISHWIRTRRQYSGDVFERLTN